MHTTPHTTSPHPADGHHSPDNATAGRFGPVVRLLATVLATVIDLLLPVRCAVCAERGSVLCLRCAAALDGPFPVSRPITATGPPVFALAEHTGTARTIVIAYKERGEHGLAAPLGRMMACVLPWLPDVTPAEDGIWWLVPVPSRARAARRRGGCHLTRLGRSVAAALAGAGHPVAIARALRLAAGTRDSVGLDASGRLANLAGRVLVRPDGLPPPGTPVVLLDDVITTGATAAACVAELTAAGLLVTAVLTVTAV